MKVVLLYNSASGGRYSLAKLRKICRANDIAITYSFTIKQKDSKKLAQLVKRGVTLMAVGGDGTINSAARLVVGTPSKLLPLPGGTLNNFVRDLEMKGSVEELLTRSKDTSEKIVDVAYVNDELFLNNSSLGFYPLTLLDRKRSSRFLEKWTVATYAAIRQLVAFRRLRIVIDGNKIRSPFIFIGNNPYNIAASLLPQRRKFNSGSLTIMIATSRSRWHLIRAGFNIIRGKVSHLDDFSLSERNTIDIYTHESELPVSIDGEVKHLSAPFYYRNQPQCLKVLVIGD